MKTCPDCAEAVLPAARVCRFCGYRFDNPTRPAPELAPARPPAPVARPQAGGSALKILAFALVVAVSVFAISAFVSREDPCSHTSSDRGRGRVSLADRTCQVTYWWDRM
jgi:hypothetical protein